MGACRAAKRDTKEEEEQGKWQKTARETEVNLRIVCILENKEWFLMKLLQEHLHNLFKNIINLSIPI